jgi:hypothetical protein
MLETKFFRRGIEQGYQLVGRALQACLVLEYLLSSSITAQTKAIKMADTAIAIP